MAKEIRICNYSIKDYFVSLYEVTAKQLELLDSLIKAYDDSMLKAEAPKKKYVQISSKELEDLPDILDVVLPQRNISSTPESFRKKVLHTELVATGGSMAICLMIFCVRSLSFLIRKLFTFNKNRFCLQS